MNDPVEIHVRWTDMDAYGHVHHATQIGLIEDGRNRWLDSILSEGETWDYAVVRVAFDYRGQLRYEDGPARCSFEVRAIGGSSVTLAETLMASDGTVVAEGETVIVAWDKGASRARPLSEGEREKLRLLER